jgi:hypothetical protein
MPRINAQSRIFGCCLAIYLLAVSAAHGLELRGSAKQCALPAGFAIADGKKLAPELRGFLGQFSGYWGDKLHHTLLVADIAADGTATAYYAHDRFGPWELNAPWCGLVPAKIENGVLTLTVAGQRAVARYRLPEPDTLQGIYERGGRTTLGAFKREE